MKLNLEKVRGGEWLSATFSSGTTQRITPRRTEGSLMRQTQKGIREVRLDVHLQVLNLLLRFPWGLSPEYITTALLSSRESLSLPQPLFSACLLRLCRKPNKESQSVSSCSKALTVLPASMEVLCEA